MSHPVKRLTFVEVDVPAFAQSSPPGSPEEIETYRFAIPTDYLHESGIDAIASMKDVDVNPAIISLGENLGQRATVTISFTDHKHIFNGEPFDQGTFFGKWRGRYGLKLRNRPLRLIQGDLGQPLADMETRHYIIDATDGPDPQDGTYKITAKDILKLADGDRAQAPQLSNGFLVAAINAVTTSATLSPAGIGNAEYPSSGHVAIAGKEICAFTRSGDVLTLTRGQLGTAADSHEEQDRVQLCLRYVGVDPADIIADLFETYAGVPSAYIPLAQWQQETASFLQRVYTTTIAEPTSVNKLISELVEQAALSIWWDDQGEAIRLRVLRSVATDAITIDESIILEGSLRSQEQPDKRISRVWTYFGQINPLEREEDPDNYRSSAETVDEDAETEYGSQAIKKIFSRWIPQFGRTVATRLNDIIIGRYRDPPRRFNFDLLRHIEVEEHAFEGGENTEVHQGDGFRLGAWTLQDEAGLPVEVPAQVTRLDPMADSIAIEAEEMLFQQFDPGDLQERVIIIDADTLNFNLRDAHDSLFPALVDSSPPSTVTCIVQSGVTVGSSSDGHGGSNAAFVVGSWPAFMDGFINVVVNGQLRGRGGDAGRGGNAPGGNGVSGTAGSTALYTRFPINLDFASGNIWGGGGGGGGGGASVLASRGGGGGGGGAGRNVGRRGVGGTSGVGDDGEPGEVGTLNSGGDGGDSGGGKPGGSGGTTGAGTQGVDQVNDGFGAGGGGGGSPGFDGGRGGNSAGGGTGGAAGGAGRAIDGNSFVTVIGSPGSTRGPTVN